MTPEKWLAQLDEPRRSELTELHELIRETVPELEPVVEDNALGYGPFHYKYASGREGDATILTLANRKQYISLYVLAAEGDKYLAERYIDALPKANIGKSCVTFKRVSDLDRKALKKLFKEAAKMGGASAV